MRIRGFRGAGVVELIGVKTDPTALKKRMQKVKITFIFIYFQNMSFVLEIGISEIGEAISKSVSILKLGS